MKQTINLIIELCIKYFSERNLKLFVKYLLTLKDEVIKLDPGKTDSGLVDLVMDMDVYDWAIETYAKISSKNYTPSDYDWEAATIIAADLQFILNNLKE